MKFIILLAVIGYVGNILNKLSTNLVYFKILLIAGVTTYDLQLELGSLIETLQAEIKGAQDSFPVEVNILQVQLKELNKYLKDVNENSMTSEELQAIEENVQAISFKSKAIIKEIQSSFVIKLNPKIAKLETKIEDSIKKANGSHPGLVKILEFDLGQLKALSKELNKDTTDIQSIAVLKRKQERVKDIYLSYEEIAKSILNSTSTNY